MISRVISERIDFLVHLRTEALKVVRSRIGGGAIHVGLRNGSRGLPRFVRSILTFRGIEFRGFFDRGGSKAFDGPLDGTVDAPQELSIDDRLCLSIDDRLCEVFEALQEAIDAMYCVATVRLQSVDRLQRSPIHDVTIDAVRRSHIEA